MFTTSQGIDKYKVPVVGKIWGWTTKIDSATRPFLKIDKATGPFLKFDMRHGHLSDMRQGYFLNLTCDIGAKIISDIRHRYF